MRNRLYIHIVWTTRNRQPTIDHRVVEYLRESLPEIAEGEHAQVLEIGIVSTHLHLLIRIHPTTVIPRLLQRMKGKTSARARIRWAKGYNIEGVSPRVIAKVAAYVRDQDKHHPEEVIRDS